MTTNESNEPLGAVLDGFLSNGPHNDSSLGTPSRKPYTRVHNPRSPGQLGSNLGRFVVEWARVGLVGLGIEYAKTRASQSLSFFKSAFRNVFFLTKWSASHSISFLGLCAIYC